MLLRYDGSTWSSFVVDEATAPTGAQAWSGWSPRTPDPIVVDGQGRVWFSTDELGLMSFDGEVVRRVDAPGLRLGALDLAVGADGALWVASRRGALYRLCIPPATAEPGCTTLSQTPYDAVAP